MTAELDCKYVIILTLPSGHEVSSIDFLVYPPEEAILAGMRLYNAKSYRIEEFDLID